LTLAEATVTAADGAWKHQISGFAEIEGTDQSESSQLILAIIRDPTHANDSYEADAGLIEFDIHFQREKDGTVPEYPT